MMSYIQHAASVEIFVKYDVHLQSRDRSWEEEEYTSPCRLFEGWMFLLIEINFSTVYGNEE